MKYTAKALINATTESALLLDINGIILATNEITAKRLGYTIQEVIGKNAFSLIPPDLAESRKRWAEIVTRTGNPVHFEDIRFGRIIENNIYPIKDENGEVFRYAIFGRDITERKTTETQIIRLSKLKERLLGTLDLVQQLKLVSDAVIEIFEADFARIWLTKDADLCNAGCIHATVTDGPNACLNRDRCLHLMVSSGRYTHIDGNHRLVPIGCYKIGRVASGEERCFITNDVIHDPQVHDHAWAQSLGLVSFAGFRLLAPDRTPIGVLALFRKTAISSREEALLEDLANSLSQVIISGIAAEALKESEAKFKALFEGANDAIFIMDSSVFLDCNKSTEAMFGCSREQILGYTPAEFSPVYQQDGRLSTEEAREKIDAALGGDPQFFEWIHQRCDRTPFNAEVSLSRVLIKGEYYVQAIVRDVTERKQADELVRVLARMSDDAPASITVHDFEGNFLYANEETFRLHGYSREEYVAKDLHEIDVPESERLIAERMQQLRNTGAAEFDVQHYRKDGSKIPLHVNVKIVDWGGKTVLLSIATDLTERKRAELALMESEQKYRDIFENSIMGLYQTTPDGKLISANEAFARMFGYPDAAELLKTKIDIRKQFYANPEDREAVLRILEEKGMIESSETSYIKRDRTPFWGSITARTIRNDEGKVIFYEGSIIDISARSWLNRHYRKQTKNLTCYPV